MYLQGFHVPVLVGADNDVALGAVQHQLAFRTVDPEEAVLTGEYGINEYVKTRRSNTQIQWLPLTLDPVLDLKAGNDVAISLIRAFQAHIEATLAHDNVLLKINCNKSYCRQQAPGIEPGQIYGGFTTGRMTS